MISWDDYKKEAAWNYKRQFPDGYINETIFEDGAEWGHQRTIEKSLEFIRECVTFGFDEKFENQYKQHLNNY